MDDDDFSLSDVEEHAQEDDQAHHGRWSAADDSANDADSEGEGEQPSPKRPHSEAEEEEEEDFGDDEDEEHGRSKKAKKGGDPRHILRINAERARKPRVNEPLLYGYLSEIYTSPRHKHIDSAYRHTVVCHVLHHFHQLVLSSGAVRDISTQTAADDDDADDDDAAGDDHDDAEGEARAASGTGDEAHAGLSGDVNIPDADPAFAVRIMQYAGWGTRERFAFQALPPPCVCVGGADCQHTPPCRKARATPSRVASRGSEIPRGTAYAQRPTSPAADVVQSVCRPVDDRDDGYVCEAAFFYDVVAHVRCVLSQYRTKAEALHRCSLELVLLAQSLARDLDATTTARGRADEGAAAWNRRFRRAMLSKHYTDDIVAVTDFFDHLCGLICNLQPGERLTPHLHGLHLLDPVYEAHPSASLTVQKLWGKRPWPGKPLGKIANPPSAQRKAALAYERKLRKSAFTGKGMAERSDDAELSSADEQKAHIADYL